MAKPKGSIEVIDGVPHWITEGPDGWVGTPVGGTTSKEGDTIPEQTLRLLEQQRKMSSGVVPKSSADTLFGNQLPRAANFQSPTVGAIASIPRVLAAVPGVVSDIARAPVNQSAYVNPVISPEVSKLTDRLFFNNPGLMKSLNDYEEDPLTAGFNVQQAVGAVKGGLDLLKALPQTAKTAKDAIVSKLIERRAGLNGPQVPFNLSELETPVTTAQQTAESLSKQGVNVPPPVVGDMSPQARYSFGTSKAGSEALKKTEEGISNLITGRGQLPGNPTAKTDQVRSLIPGLIEGKINAVNPDILKQLQSVNSADKVSMVWDEIAKNASKGEDGILNAKMLIDYINKNGKNLKGLLGGEQNVALQEFAHGLKKTQEFMNGAVRPSKNGMKFLYDLPLAGTVGAFAGPKAAAAVVGAKRLGSMYLNSNNFSKILADPEGKWILARMAGKKASDPSIVADLQKLAALAGKVGVQAKIITGTGAGPQDVSNED